MITTQITCDQCNGEVHKSIGAFSLMGESTESSFTLVEPLKEPKPEHRHYCSPGCVEKALAGRVMEMWERRRQTIESIMRMTGKGEGDNV